MSSIQLSHLFGVIGFMWATQLLLSYFQQKSFFKAARELSRKGDVVIGKKPKKIGAGSVVILCVSKEGYILSTEYMEGMTIFARLKKIDTLNGFSIHQDITKITCVSKVVKEALKEAQKVYLEKFQPVLNS